MNIAIYFDTYEIDAEGDGDDMQRLLGCLKDWYFLYQASSAGLVQKVPGQQCWGLVLTTFCTRPALLCGILSWIPCRMATARSPIAS